VLLAVFHLQVDHTRLPKKQSDQDLLFMCLWMVHHKIQLVRDPMQIKSSE